VASQFASAKYCCAIVGFAAGSFFSTIACATPLDYLHSSGDKADTVLPLTWGVTLVSAAVIATISFLVAGAIWHRPGIPEQVPGTELHLERPVAGLGWIWIGAGISTLILLASVVWTMEVLAKVSSPATKPPLTIQVTGKQWWWQIHYLSDDPSRTFATANEIHIPTGVPVKFLLVGGDVIHSFWVPALSGKTDTIPGQTNETWLEARNPGTYWGQCTEYCGLEHAHMAFLVVAQTPSDFKAWWDHQLQSPAPNTNGQVAAGMLDFNMHCGSCHAVRGTDAAGMLGPDLSHLMTRQRIAAGVLPNDPVNLEHLISDPQGVKPGILMQRPELSHSEFTDIQAYLKTLN
jgi:cytochrome c oxidase subunit 2